MTYFPLDNSTLFFTDKKGVEREVEVHFLGMEETQ
jgi:hypothetical protein